MELLIAFSWLAAFGVGAWLGLRIGGEDWADIFDKGYDSGYRQATQYIREYADSLDTFIGYVRDDDVAGDEVEDE